MVDGGCYDGCEDSDNDGDDGIKTFYHYLVYHPKVQDWDNLELKTYKVKDENKQMQMIITLIPRRR